MKPILAITMGDPAGVGPEILVKALSRPRVRKKASFVILGDRAHLNAVQKKIFHRTLLNNISIIDYKNINPKGFRYGRATAEYGRASVLYVEQAVRLALQNYVDAIVTCPISKLAVWKGGGKQKLVGHTEMLAGLTGARHVALMMLSGPFRVVHVTSHVPHRKVSSLIKKPRIIQTIRLAHEGLRRLGFQRPRIAVSALNPHGGESGTLGREESDEILPAIKTCRKQGMDIGGPIPGDVLWPLLRDKHYDVGVAMYHDQGQIPIKLNAMKNIRGKRSSGGVNMTLGLPIIRTSVAHGTAYDIAGKGTASEASLIEAIDLACQLVKRK